MRIKPRWIFGGLVTMAAVGTMQTMGRYNAWKREALARLEAGSQVVETAYGPIEYASLGEGPAVLVLHGSPGGYDQALAFARIAGPAGYRYICPSRPGYLRTPLTVAATPAGQADACASLLDALGLRPVERAAVIGISGGGPAALQFALRHADRCWGLVMAAACSRRWVSSMESPGNRALDAIVLTDPGVWAVSRLIASQAKRLAPVISGDYPEFASHIAKDPEKLRLFVELGETMGPASVRKAGWDNDVVELGAVPDYPLERVQVPTLALHGKQDRNVAFADAEIVAQKVPGARLVAFEGGDHTFFIAHREEVAAALGEFFASCAQTKPL